MNWSPTSRVRPRGDVRSTHTYGGTITPLAGPTMSRWLNDRARSRAIVSIVFTSTCG